MELLKANELLAHSIVTCFKFLLLDYGFSLFMAHGAGQMAPMMFANAIVKETLMYLTEAKWSETLLILTILLSL